MTAERRSAPIRPTPERIAKGGVIENPEARGEKPKPWWTFESPHDGLLAAGLISKQAWQAGEDFKRTWYLACGSGVAGGSVGTKVDGATADIGRAQSDAKGRLQRWSRALAPEIYRCLETVMGIGHPPTAWASEAGWHPATARVFVCTCLEQFALTNGAIR